MAKEVLAIPEDNLAEFIEILESGLKSHKNTSENVKQSLQEWIEQEKEYIKSWSE